MATWSDVDDIARPLGAEACRTRSGRAWTGSGRGVWNGPGTGGQSRRLVVWERPLRARDIADVGAQDGPVIGIRVVGESAKATLIAEDPQVFLTTSHFDGWPAILVRLDRIERARLRELIEHAWSIVSGP